MLGVKESEEVLRGKSESDVASVLPPNNVDLVISGNRVERPPDLTAERLGGPATLGTRGRVPETRGVGASVEARDGVGETLVRFLKRITIESSCPSGGLGPCDVDALEGLRLPDGGGASGMISLGPSAEDARDDLELCALFSEPAALSVRVMGGANIGAWGSKIGRRAAVPDMAAWLSEAASFSARTSFSLFSKSYWFPSPSKFIRACTRSALVLTSSISMIWKHTSSPSFSVTASRN